MRYDFVVIGPTLFTETTPCVSSRFGNRPRRIGSSRRRHRAAYPDLAGNIRFIEGSTSLTIQTFCSMPLGGLYGVKHIHGHDLMRKKLKACC